MTTMAHTWKPSPAQVQLMKDVFKERVTLTGDEREQAWRNAVENVSNQATFESVLNELKKLPKIQSVVVTPPVVVPDLPELASEDGLYRDPQTGLLYRLTTPKKKNSWDHPQTIVSVYSRVGTQRRLTVHDEKVKGTWKRFKSYESRMYLAYTRRQKTGEQPVEGGSKVLKNWWMTQQDKMDYKYGICMFCMRGLEDERSVRYNYGPVCAKALGLPWND